MLTNLIKYYLKSRICGIFLFFLSSWKHSLKDLRCLTRHSKEKYNDDEESYVWKYIPKILRFAQNDHVLSFWIKYLRRSLLSILLRSLCFYSLFRTVILSPKGVRNHCTDYPACEESNSIMCSGSLIALEMTI